MFKPIDYQKHVSFQDFIEEYRGGAEGFDVLFVGAGPASLSGAIKLAQLSKKGGKELSIAVVEKSEAIGHHILSGAIINPQAFRELFPEMGEKDFPFSSTVKKDSVYFLTKNSSVSLPVPPLMNNHGNYIASLSEATRWLAKKAEELGVTIFTGFPAKALLVRDGKVSGIRTAEKGLGRNGERQGNFEPSVDIEAKVTVLGEGTRGFLSRSFFRWQNIRSENPQIYALGVKEIWEVRNPLDSVVHTMGWPLPSKLFGGSFMYPMDEKTISIGLVVGLNYPDYSLDPHALFQLMKTHKLFRKYLGSGERLEWGAKTIPEGGYYSVPERLSSDGCLVIGDSAGFVNVPSLKGVHYSMSSGILAAKAIHEAFEKSDFSSQSLSAYDRYVRQSFIMKDLSLTRNMRQSFDRGFYAGMVNSALMYATGGRYPFKRLPVHRDADYDRKFSKPIDIKPDGKLTFSKLDSVHKSGNMTRDNIPKHLITIDNIPDEVVESYVRICPAGVYEKRDGKLVINAPNCIDCMTTDIIAPRWTPREGGSGPRYKRM